MWTLSNPSALSVRPEARDDPRQRLCGIAGVRLSGVVGRLAEEGEATGRQTAITWFCPQ